MRLVLAAAILSLTATAVFAADSAQAVLDHHVKAMTAGDLDAVMSDYADDALLIAPHGIAPGQTNVSGNDVFSGKSNIRKFFAVLTDKGHNPAFHEMTSTFESRGNDVMLMKWVQFKGKPNQVSGTDTWIIRGGKVVAQVVAVDPPPTPKR
ncbi:MAG: nuclear transport factor 2 family protein [Alphaproteobacteria bacterium]|nr:nuclear transport factor 2 family protein [Alphaproteobacteria bacterium]